jgi:hypothetical protein
MNKRVSNAVRRRAGFACEYCRVPQAAYRSGFEIDHVIARQHGGRTVLSNLAFACYHCNCHKGPNIAGIDPRSNRLVGLYHPRRHRWSTHFRWDGPYLIGRTAIGRATVAVLAINAPEAVAVRAALIREGHFPPE